MTSKNNLLVCTQVIDRQSTSLGFMSHWVDELAKVYDNVTVVCLYKGVYDAPANVKVISLGKEKSPNSSASRLKYILNFYRAIFSERKNYKKVFIHMNDEYLLLGGLIWLMMGKYIVLWSNHYYGTWKRTLGAKVCSKVFYTSKFSYTANKKRFPQGMQMPVGVDVESLNTVETFEVPNNSILFLARLDPSKKPEIVLQAIHKLLQDKDCPKFTCNLVGGVSVDKWPNYEAELRRLKEDLKLGDIVRFVGAVPSNQTYKYYRSHDIYVNVAKSGMLDKTIFESLVAGCLPLTTSIDFNEMVKGAVGDEFLVAQDSASSLAEKLKNVLTMDTEHKRHKVKLMQDLVIDKNSLKNLVATIHKEV